MLERPSRASPQPENSVDQNLVKYFRGMELISDKVDNLGDQITGMEHGLSNKKEKKYMKFFGENPTNERLHKIYFPKFWSWKSNTNEEYKQRTLET